jgi:KipI family sensor histidine kinase inhibitor
MEAVRVIWASEREVHVVGAIGHALAAYRALRFAGIDGVDEVTIGTATVQLRIGARADIDEVLLGIRSVLEHSDAEPTTVSTRLVEIPVCSDGELAPDLEALARATGLSAEAAADLHASGEYTVGFLGFAPGFAYMEGLPEQLHAPRLGTPRSRLRAGSVGIAGARTGIYPQASPGGWRIIGATPLRMFDAARDRPSLLAPGDRVRFRRIDRDEYDRMLRGQG